MGKSQPDKIHVLGSLLPSGASAKRPVEAPKEPPKIPPRMKKKGPALPAKPPHMRAKNPEDSRLTPAPSSQATKENFLDPSRNNLMHFRLTNFDRQQTQKPTEREILVAASKAGRERPVERRQREPAKLLAPTTGSRPEISSSENHLSTSKKIERLKKDAGPVAVRKHPLMLIPRGFLVDNRGGVNQLWGSAPVSYAVWMQRERERAHKPQELVPHSKIKSILTSATSAKARSSSVTRSGSLTSQGSSSSDSGNETFPKSVLKKQKRNGGGGSLNPKSNHKIEHKKNVTFNAFATVQLMEQ